MVVEGLKTQTTPSLSYSCMGGLVCTMYGCQRSQNADKLSHQVLTPSFAPSSPLTDRTHVEELLVGIAGNSVAPSAQLGRLGWNSDRGTEWIHMYCRRRKLGTALTKCSSCTPRMSLRWASGTLTPIARESIRTYAAHTYVVQAPYTGRC